MSMTADAVGTLAARLERDWGYGRRFVSISAGPCWGSAIAECTASDGSRWYIGCGPYGENFTYADTHAQVMDALVASLGVAI